LPEKPGGINTGRCNCLILIATGENIAQYQGGEFKSFRQLEIGIIAEAGLMSRVVS